MYPSLLLPWSPDPTPAETRYRAAGLVKTKGTIFILPPAPATLRATFNAPPRPQSRMSAGAVALCKHVERGGASSEHGRLHPFWTLPGGSNERKSAVAAEVLEEMLRSVAWRNVMVLHEGVAVYEVRNARGYGMRWTLEVERSSSSSSGVGGEDEGDGDGDAGENGETHVNADADTDADCWRIKKTTFRGFLEPIAGMDHELES